MKRRLFYFAVAVVSIIVAVIVWQKFIVKPNKSPVDRAIVARVAGDPITRLELESEINYRLMKQFSKVGILRGPDMPMIRFTALEQIINDRIVYLMAKRENKVVTDEEVEALLTKIYQVYGKGRNLTESALARMMGYTSIADFRRVIRINAQEIKLVEAMSPKSPPTADDIKNEIPRVHLRQIFLSLPPRDESPGYAGRYQAMLDFAESLRRRALSGEDFGELAKQNSQETQGARGGDLGWVRRSEVMPEFANMGQKEEKNGASVFNLKKGEISRVFQTPLGLHIVQCLDRKDPSDPDYEISLDVVKMYLTDKKKREVFLDEFRRTQVELETQGKIEVLDPLLRAYWYRSRQMNAEALTAFQQARDEMPDEAYVYVGIGDLMRERMMYKETIENYTRAIRLTPNDPYIYIRLGRAYYEMGDRVNAMLNLQRGSDLSRYDAALHQFLEKFYFDIGETERAQAEHEKTLKAIEGLGASPTSAEPGIGAPAPEGFQGGMGSSSGNMPSSVTGGTSQDLLGIEPVQP